MDSRLQREVAKNVNTGELGDMIFSAGLEESFAAFMNPLTDVCTDWGWRPQRLSGYPVTLRCCGYAASVPF